MTSTTEYEDCVEYIKPKYGEELTSICDIKDEDIHIEKDLVVGWLLIRDYETIPGKTYLNLYPIIYVRSDYEGRDAVHDTLLGYYTVGLDDPCAYGYIIDVNKVLKKEKIIGILPAQPNTYYVRYFVNVNIKGVDCIAFSIGVMYNPDTKEIIEIAKKKYYEWLRSYEFEELVEKYKTKSKSKNS